MKTRLVFILLTMGWGVCEADVFVENFDGLNQAISEGNPVGVTLNETISDIPSGGPVFNVTVSLVMSGGFNGDLYGYIVAPNGAMVTLVNNPGVTDDNPFGYGGSGFNVILSDAASASIQTTSESAGAVLSGAYQAAGALADLDGSAANGDWTLFFSDNSVGGGQTTIEDFSLDITSTPEPANVALVIFAALVVGSGGMRWGIRRGRSGPAGQ